MRSAAELVLSGQLNAVPRARRFTTRALVGEPQTTIENAEVLVAELVTNALLHGAGPVTLRLIQLEDRTRIEVEDTGRALPLQVHQSHEAMTGRGLTLVAALSSGWGVESGSNGGKVVWAELPQIPVESIDIVPPELDIEELLASWTDDVDTEPTYTIHLGAVPTDLLLAAKAHIDNVVRELTLAKNKEATTGVGLAPEMIELVDTVTSDFAEARTEIKRQAVQAATRGDALTDLVLTLPATAADAGERYLAALEEADRYSRAARLLTIAPPRSHRTFRRWYVQSLVDQLRAAARGDTSLPPPRPFPEVLADEVERLSSLEETWHRLQLLQKVTAELTGARSVSDIAKTVVDNAAEFLGADSARVYLLTSHDTLRSVAIHGGTDPEFVSRYDEFSIADNVPGSVVIRTGQPVFLRNLAQIAEQFPSLRDYYPSERTLHVAPLTIGDHTLGVLSLTFAGSQPVDEETQVAFVRALADALAQAVERSLAIAQAESAKDRLEFLADASVALSTSLDVEATLGAITRLLVPRLADWCSIQLARGGTLETVALLHSDPERTKWGRSMAGRFAVKMDAPSGAPLVLRTGRSEIYPDIPPELLAEAAVSDEHLEVIERLGMSSALVVPLTGRSGTFGVISLIYAESSRRYDATDVAFVEDVAARAALALETAQTFHEQSGRLASVTRVAEAAQRAILAQPPTRIGAITLAARYVSAAAEALVGGDLYEVVARPDAVRLLIGDVRGKGLSAVRTATIVLGEFRAAAADIADLRKVARQIDRRVRPYLADEDFVTALIAEVSDDGHYRVVSCGHPPALLASGNIITALELDHSVPLGLGSDPAVTVGKLSPGDRLLLYTDGVMEARDDTGAFVNLMHVVEPFASGDIEVALDHVLARLHEITGPELGDDLALIAAEYSPEGSEGRVP